MKGTALSQGAARPERRCWADAWGTTYVAVTELLPAGRPLLVATVRVVPAGLALLAIGTLTSRWRPRGAEWWRTGAMAACNFGIFFPLVVAVYRLPGGVAAAMGGLQPLLVVLLSALVTGARPRKVDVAVGFVAALGVGLVVLRPGAGIDPVGLLAAAGADLSFATGVVLTKRFPAPANRVAATGWQLLLAGALLVPLTFWMEGAPPPSAAQRGRVRLPQPGRHGVGLRALVQRHPAAPGGGTSPSGARRPRHRRRARLGRPRPGAVAGPAHRLRRHAGGHRLRRHAANRAAPICYHWPPTRARQRPGRSADGRDELPALVLADPGRHDAARPPAGGVAALRRRRVDAGLRRGVRASLRLLDGQADRRHPVGRRGPDVRPQPTRARLRADRRRGERPRRVPAPALR